MQAWKWDISKCRPGPHDLLQMSPRLDFPIPTVAWHKTAYRNKRPCQYRHNTKYKWPIILPSACWKISSLKTDKLIMDTAFEVVPNITNVPYLSLPWKKRFKLSSGKYGLSFWQWIVNSFLQNLNRNWTRQNIQQYIPRTCRG